MKFSAAVLGYDGGGVFRRKADGGRRSVRREIDGGGFRARFGCKAAGFRWWWLGVVTILWRPISVQIRRRGY